MEHTEPRWILELTFYVIASSVRLALTADPERATSDKEVVIKGVSAFHAERYHDPAKVCLGDYLGWSITPHGALRRYRLDTGDAIVHFDATETMPL